MMAQEHGISDSGHELGNEPIVPGVPPPGRKLPLVGHLVRLRARPPALLLVLASMGPGLVAANAGNDAGGIATYATVGSTAGYSLLWMFPLILISLAVVQEM